MLLPINRLGVPIEGEDVKYFLKFVLENLSHVVEDVEYFFKVVLEWEDVEYFFKA